MCPSDDGSSLLISAVPRPQSQLMVGYSSADVSTGQTCYGICGDKVIERRESDRDMMLSNERTRWTSVTESEIKAERQQRECVRWGREEDIIYKDTQWENERDLWVQSGSPQIYQTPAWHSKLSLVLLSTASWATHLCGMMPDRLPITHQPPHTPQWYTAHSRKTDCALNTE